MASPEQRLKELGIELPEPWEVPNGLSFVPCVRTGNLLFVAGHGPLEGRTAIYKGKCGRELSTEQGYQAARLTALYLLAAIRKELGSLDRVRRIVKVIGFVSAEESYSDMPYVVNGASDLFLQVFGQRGRHARCAIGVFQLPFNIPVEVEVTLEFQ